MLGTPLIGGFFELGLGQPLTEGSLANHWELPEDPGQTFTNARSALALFASTHNIKKAWLPAYVCPSVVDALTTSLVAIHFYGVGEDLQPDTTFLDQHAKPGDLILAINYFGQAPADQFREFVNRREDLVFVEDCAQSMDTGCEVWGDWRLFSPRKLIGVADGGYIVPRDPSEYTLPPSLPLPSVDHWLAALLRFEDQDKTLGQDWNADHQKKEMSMGVSMAQMSRLSRELLTRLDANSIIKQRGKNFQHLYDHFPLYSFIKDPDPSFCPLGFVMRFPAPQREFVREELIKEGIFPAIHWTGLPSPTDHFPQEHHLAQQLLTIPCDQRYGEDSMDRIVQILTHALDNYK